MKNTKKTCRLNHIYEKNKTLGDCYFIFDMVQ